MVSLLRNATLRRQGQVYVAIIHQPAEGKLQEQASLVELNWEEIEKLRSLLGLLEKKDKLEREVGFTLLKILVGMLIKGELPFIVKSSKSNKDKLWLHHFCLGHPSFRVLKLMFPLLFKGLDVEDFHCDVCELAKHKRVSFPITNKSSLPFTIIHNDIWSSMVCLLY